ncbi:MAG TPA: hypothetical protein VMF06_09925 [Candidatus Limnocylindria bacterium]|jgi:hypothetical protein|nr:hypothetical protein [Candidatus Limnocylindria bacterium]
MKNPLRWTAVAGVIALAVAIQGFYFTRQNRTIRRLETELANLLAAKESQDGEINDLKSKVAGMRSAQESTESLLSATIVRLNQMVLATNAASRIRTAPATNPEVAVDPVEPEKPKEKRMWGPEQAEGKPDTMRAGDLPTAWASREPDAGVEWLKVEFENWVEPVEVRVRETFNPGAISAITAVQTGGQEVVVWQGVEPIEPAPTESVFQTSLRAVTRQIVIYLDTSLVPGWNEIDAVQLVGKDGSHQWASKATASSTYAERFVNATVDGLQFRPLGGEVVPGGITVQPGTSE